MLPNPRHRLVVLAAAVAIAATIVVVTNDDDTPVDTPTTTTSRVTTTSRAPTSTTSTTAPRTVSDAEAATIVWPDPGGDVVADDPTTVVRTFAEELAGFRSPVIGEYLGGDQRSGEIEVRPSADGPATTVAVRRMSDERWYVIAVASPEVEIDVPAVGAAIDHPLQVAGRGRSTDGAVRVAVFVRGATSSQGTGSVPVSTGTAPEPFSGEVAWDNPSGGWGAVVVTTAEADGSVRTATAFPVGFIGGD